MSNKPGPNIAASIRHRLLNNSKQTDRPFQELLQYFAMERFLYRFSRSHHAGHLHPDRFDSSLRQVTTQLAGFLGPVANALETGERFDHTWSPPGLWRSTQS
jgi:hypothetical protein